MVRDTGTAVAPVATTTAGSWIQDGSNALNSALEIWGNVERVKSARSATGNDQTVRVSNPELANGAGVNVDMTTADHAQQQAKSSGIADTKGLLYASLAVLAMGVFFKAKGLK